MPEMSLGDGHWALEEDWKKLHHRWDEARREWHDMVRLFFELCYWHPIEQETQRTLEAMEQLAIELAQARAHV